MGMIQEKENNPSSRTLRNEHLGKKRMMKLCEKGTRAKQHYNTENREDATKDEAGARKRNNIQQKRKSAGKTNC